MECVTCNKHEMIECEIKTLKESLVDHSTRLSSLERQTNKTEVKFEIIVETLKELKQKIDEICQRPKKNWDILVYVFMTSVVSGFVGFVISKIVR